MNFEVIVAGAGLWGCTIARVMAERGKKVLVLEKRSIIGGNAACEIDPATGIEIHSYGSHIFHTHDLRVWNFIRRFTEFNGYQHKVLANYRGKTYFLPLGLNLINKFFNVELKPSEVVDFLSQPAKENLTLKNSDILFNAFIRGYTSKQWGKPPEEIAPSILKRLPIRENFDTNYYSDYCQGIPLNGYNDMFFKMLDHSNITVKLSTSFAIDQIHSLPNDRTVYYSGPLDALFDYKFGALKWRSLRFEIEHLAMTDYQGTAVVNYTETEIPFTRIHEFKHYHPESKAVMEARGTVICREYPCEWKLGMEPYYPVDCEETRVLVAKYEAELQKLNAALLPKGIKLYVGGRLGKYRYFDMDQTIAQALDIAS